MLISFSVTNFRSFAAEQTFSMVASKRIADAHHGHLAAIPDSDESALRGAVLYGANGAGKSNLFKALRYLKSVALSARRSDHGTGRVPFRLAEMSGKPSTFDLQFVAKNSLYRFGFSVDDQRIVEEWLARVAGGREKPIYERRTNADGRVEVEAPGLKNEGEKLAALVTVGGPHNQSFLATVRTTLQPQDFGATLTDVIGWLDASLTLVGPAYSPFMLAGRLAMDPEFRDFAGGFLQASATGIDSIRVDKSELPPEEIDSVLPPSVTSFIRKSAGQASALAPDGSDVTFERDDSGEHFYRVAIQAVHRHEPNKEVVFDLPEESDGTRRLLSLMPALHKISKGSAVFVIDEIDRSMHPMLVYKFIEYFLNAAYSGFPSQIIVTTHETHLLTLDLLRRDEIWFAEKDRSGATNLYSLTDFKVRNDLRIRNGYLEGRFGAVPFLGDIDQLIETDTRGAACP
jgi:AAA15 family ATPase/GTPase